MNPRERLLLILVGCVLGGLALKGVVSLYMATREELKKDIESEQEELAELKADIEEAEDAQERWEEVGAHTLSMNEEEVYNRFRVVMVDLLKKVGLPDAEYKQHRIGSYGRHKLRALSCTVRTPEGGADLDTIKKLLFEVHRQPFLIRCRSLRMSPIMTKPPSRRGKNQPAEQPKPTGRFDLTAKFETLILPEAELVRSVDTLPAPPDEIYDEEFPRTDFKDLSKYVAFRRDLFEEFKPPLPPPTKPLAPNPPHNGSIQETDRLTLRWRPGQNAKTHQVFFGETEDVASMGTTPGPTFTITKNLEVDKTYYWRVDEINESGATPGDLWSFKVLPPDKPGKVVNPNPADNARLEEPASVVLRWRPGANANAHEVFFGDTPEVEKLTKTTAPTYTIREKLEIGQTYYWRVDAINDQGTTPGDLWSFAIVPKPLPPAYPDFVIRGVLSSPRAQQAVLMDPKQQRNPNAEPVRVEVGDRLNLGTLVFVHPTGVVTEEDDGRRRFHPIGEVVKSGAYVSEDSHPLVYHELAKLEKRDAGISDQKRRTP